MKPTDLSDPLEVTYARDAESADVRATIGRTVFEVDNGRGILEKYESRDFLILTQDLVLGGTPSLPERGDKVRETQGGTVHVYEVMAPGKEPHYRYSDPYRKTLRVHTMGRKDLQKLQSTQMGLSARVALGKGKETYAKGQI